MVGTFRSGGRNAKPSWVKQAEGNPGKRAIKPPMDAQGELPRAPAYFNREQQLCWFEITESLPRGVLVRADANCVERMCVSWATFREAGRQLKKLGLIEEKPSGITRRSLWLDIRAQSAREMTTYSSELGLSPQARTRIGAQPQPSDDPMELLMGGDASVWSFEMEPEEDKAN